MWTVIESNLGIICACLPALRRPLGFIFPYISGRVNRSWGYSGPQKETRSEESRGRPLNSAPRRHLGWSVLDESVVTVGDGGSQERIESGREGEGGVRKTTEVVVRFHRRERERDRDGEGEGEREGANRGIEMRSW